MSFGAVLIGIFVLGFVALIVVGVRAGPPRLTDGDLAGAVVLRKATRDNPGSGWTWLGAATTARGLDLKFDANDDPQAEASFLVEDRGGGKRSTFALNVTVPLSDRFETHHVHTRGYVFRVRMRGGDSVVGREVRIQMHVDGKGKPVCGRVENDEDLKAAVGGWIEFESVEVLRTAKGSRRG